MADNKQKKKPVVDEVLELSDRRKTLISMYGGDDQALRNRYDKAGGRVFRSNFNENKLNEIFEQVGSSRNNKKNILGFTNHAYAVEPLFAKIIDYLSNMFLWRNYFIPVKMKDRAKDSEYEEIYNIMTEVIDGVSIETTFPEVLTRLLRDGEVYIYTVKNTPSKTVSTMILNSQYCKPLTRSQYGTGTFKFDLKYFDELGLKNEELLEAIMDFPEEIVLGYLEYKKGGPQQLALDGRFSTYLSTNEFGFPSYISVLKSVFDYDKYRKNEVERNSAQLEKIIVHRIPSYENRLLFELPEVAALHKSMALSLANSRTRLLTTFGDTNILPLQESSKEAIEVLRSAQEAIYSSSGSNANIFMGKTDFALDLTITKDQAVVWKYVTQLVNFYNLTINNLFNFRGYQLELVMLPITHFNYKDMTESYRRSAEYGIGKLEAIVASGIKQKHIASKAALEDFLKLDDILIPLQSSHTRSSKDAEVEKSESEDKTEPKTDDTLVTPDDDVDKDSAK